MQQLVSAILLGLLATSVTAGEAFVVTTPGKPGTGGVVPSLAGSGPLTLGSLPNALHVADALPGAPAVLVLGLSELAVPFQGGVLGPAPDALQFGLSVDANGELAIPFEVPTALPAGFQLWVQAYVSDVAGFAGRSATNTLALEVQAPSAASTLFPGAKFPLGDVIPRALASEDVDGDGHVDMLVAQAPDEVAVFSGTGDGSFHLSDVHQVGLSPTALALGDLNGDGARDLVVANRASGSVSVLLADGLGSFAAATEIPIAPQPTQVALIDFDDDAQLDLVVALENAQPGGDNLFVFAGLGDGSFGARLGFAVGNEPRAFASGDFVGDAQLDLVVGCAGALSSNGEIWVLRRDELGVPGVKQVATLTGTLRDLAVADLDLDGTLDVIVGSSGGAGLAVFRGLGGGALDEPDALTSGGVGDRLLSVGDTNGDALPDLVVVHTSSGGGSLLRNTGAGNFAAPQTFGVGVSPRAVAGLDVNGDGSFDVVVANGGTHDLSVLLSDGATGLLGSRQFYAGEDASTVTLGDLDGDGHLDLACARLASFTGGFVSLLLGDGQGGLSYAADLSTSHAVIELVQIADVDLDGAQDVVVAMPFFGSAGVFWGLGGGSFGPMELLPVGLLDPTVLVVDDLDDDGVRDLVFADGGGDRVVVLLGEGDRAFAAQQNVATGGSESLAVADLNRDGVRDLVVGHGASAQVSVLFGVGDGSFGPPVDYAVAGMPVLVGVADLDADAFPDVVALVRPDGSGRVLRNVGDGSFAFGQELALGPGVAAFALGDLDGDGHPDLAACFSATRDVSVLLAHGDGEFGEPQRFGVSDKPAAGIALGDLDEDGQLDLAVAPALSNMVTRLLHSKVE